MQFRNRNSLFGKHLQIQFCTRKKADLRFRASTKLEKLEGEKGGFVPGNIAYCQMWGVFLIPADGVGCIRVSHLTHEDDFEFSHLSRGVNTVSSGIMLIYDRLSTVC